MITIQEAQKLRLEGFNVLTNRNLTKVLKYSKDELKEGKNQRLFKSMVKVIITAKQQKDAWDLHCKINNI